ncbi:cholinesterase-like [Diadema antillarum]|uniref:cholinesterase-like n=1 Tax=Diadema antillarum TaxID=105358 RepID=UPI003A881A9A
MRLLWTLLAIFAIFEPLNAENPRVTVKEGTLVGKTVTFSENKFINKTRDVDVFLGVPYAAPPERFAPPTNMTSWEGERNATEFEAVCQQGVFDFFPPVEKMSEDCLYLNVFAPNPKMNGSAVMVFIHGGSFSMGTAMTAEYSGVPLVSVGDVIIVTINYRLNIFSFFTTADEEAPGNVGMLDQVAALKWVYTNIEAFGGDKDRITIFGVSAGSGSVSFHLLSKLSRPYFSHAIMESGTAVADWAFNDLDRELEQSRAVGVAMNCSTSSSEALVECLREKDANKLRETAEKVYIGGYQVTLDGTFLEDTPKNLYSKGDFAHVPIIAGFNEDEGTFFLYGPFPDYRGSETPPPYDRAAYLAAIQFQLAFYNGLDDAIIYDSVDQEYTDWSIADNITADYFDSVVDFLGDLLFVCPTDYVTRAHAAHGGPVYQYFMTHVPTKSFYEYEGTIPNTPWLGATHGEEMTFVWGVPFIDELYHVKGHNMTDEENALSVMMMQFWTNFAKSGNPSKPSMDSDPLEGQYAWPEYTIPELTYKEIAIGLPTGRAVRARQCHFWNHYFPSLVAFTDDISDIEKEWRESYDDWKTEMTAWQQAFEEYKNEPTCS